MIAPARRFSCLSMPSCLTFEQSNAAGTSGSMDDLVVTLYLSGEGATTRLVGAPRPGGFAVASSASDTAASPINSPTKTRRLKNADVKWISFSLDEVWAE